MTKKIHQTHWTQLGMPWDYKMRNFNHLNGYLDELYEDIYEQPVDEKHTFLAITAAMDMVYELENCDTVLDVGCGEAFMQDTFEEMGMEYLGVCLGTDYLTAHENGKNVDEQDFNFLPYPEETFDLIFARHALEHSPMPILTLFDWHRVAKHWLCLIMPKPKFWQFIGRNHYSVMALSQCRVLLRRAGWDLVYEDHTHPWEYRFLCKKIERKFIAEVPVDMYQDDDLSWIDELEGDEYDEEDIHETDDEEIEYAEVTL
jgi:ubiquinone/menaquinone biosynthesis C-methylase UbiE